MALIDGLVSDWELNSDSADSIGTNPGTDTAITYGAGGASGDGATSKIDAGTANLNLSALSIEVTVKPVTGGYLFLVCRTAAGGTSVNYELLIDAAGKLTFYSGSISPQPSPPTLSSGTTYHAVITRSVTGVANLYVNGVLSDGPWNSGAGANLAAAHTFLGTRDDDLTHLNGTKIHRARIWNRELSPAEVSDLYNGGAGLAFVGGIVPIPVDPKVLAYSQALKQLLPRGRLWNLEQDSEISNTLLAIGGELARVDARGMDLIKETDPRTATETIADWERILALPDDRVLAIPGTLAARRVAATAKFVAREGQSVAFFVRLAAACGYTLLPAGQTPEPVISNVAYVPAGLGGLAAGTRYYRVVALNWYGNTLPSVEVSAAGLGAHCTFQITWGKVPGATSYRVYGRAAGAELLLAEVAAPTLTWLDDGSITPAGPLPVSLSAADEPITKFAARMLRCGFRVGDRCWGEAWAYAMQLNVLSVSSDALSLADFTRVIQHVTHSHIVAVINVL